MVIIIEIGEEEGVRKKEGENAAEENAESDGDSDGRSTGCVSH